jgi:signal transduction histidine kinase
VDRKNQARSLHTASLLANVYEDLEILFTSSTDSVSLIEPNGTILAVNNVSANWLQHTPDALVGKNLFQILTAFGVPIREWVHDVCKKKEILETELHIEDRYIAARLIPVTDEKNKVIRLIIFGQDVSEHKRVEKRMRELTGELEKKVRERTLELETLNQRLTEDKGRAELLAIFSQHLMKDTQDYRHLLEHISSQVSELINGVCIVAVFTPDLTGVEVVAISDQDIESLPHQREQLLNRTIFFEDNDFFETLLDGKRISEKDLTKQKGEKILPPEFSAQLGEKGLKALEVFPLLASNQAVGAMAIGRESGSYFSDDELAFIVNLASPIALAIQNSRLFMMLTENETQLRGLSQKLVQIQEKQYSHLAKELHDRVGQDMTAININLNIIRTLLPAQTSKDIISRLDDTEQLVQESVVRMRSTMAEFRPPMLDQYGLTAALYWYSEQYMRRTGIVIDINDRYLKDTRLPSDIEIALFRIVQEALNNIAKYANASQVNIEFLEQKDKILMTVTDNGTGFKVEQQEINSSGHWGMTIMRERARAINGQFFLRSVPGKGTQVVVQVRKET